MDIVMRHHFVDQIVNQLQRIHLSKYYHNYWGKAGVGVNGRLNPADTISEFKGSIMQYQHTKESPS